MKVVHVRWLDSEAAGEWLEIKDQVRPLSLTDSVGMLIAETENSIVLALSRDSETESILCHQHIPITAIEEIRTLCHVNLKT